MKNRVVTFAVAAAVLFGVTSSARAQDPAPAFEFGVGYQLLRTGEFFDDEVFDEGDECELGVTPCDPARTFPFGINVDAVRNFGPIGVVGEIGWSFDSEDALFGDDIFDEVPELGDIEGTFDTWHAAGGVRYTGGAAVRPYGQVLVGVVGSRFKMESGPLEFESSQTNFMVQPGVGVTFGTGGVGFFGQIDYRRVFGIRPAFVELAIDEDLIEFDEEDLDEVEFDRNDFRFVIGVRFSL
jgi:hypothetical protein